jgi:hypothetical protein
MKVAHSKAPSKMFYLNIEAADSKAPSKDVLRLEHRSGGFKPTSDNILLPENGRSTFRRFAETCCLYLQKCVRVFIFILRSCIDF